MMTPERWEQVGQLYQAALDLQPGERTSFLRRACGEDKSLCREVESLLAAKEEAGDFLAAGAIDDAAKALAEEKSFSPVGKRLGHYQVLSLLGTGGMGEVYLAQDTKLDRAVALKILPAEFATDRRRMRRFEQEARSAAALNHSHIAHVYEIGESEGKHFISMEYIEGETLRDKIHRGKLPLPKVLKYLAQVAGGLAKAHERGIVHRDLKPENIMITRDGEAKILDFGLAKLALLDATTDAQAHAESMVTTNPGVVMGTVQYMSPEQARGLEVDARTDIWSLGVVLYEMATGRAPFQGETPSHVIVSILEKEPLPLARYPEVPEELERIVMKALRKNKEERYQTAGDLAHDLKILRQEFAVEARLRRSLKPDSKGRETATLSEGQDVFAAVPPSEARTLPVDISHSTSGAEYATSKIKSYKQAPALVFGLVILIVAVAFGLYTFLRGDPTSTTTPAAPFQTIEFNRFTNSGRVKDAVISPDGKYVAYVAEDGGRESIWLKQVTSSNNVEIVPPTETQFHGATFSHDSIYLYYIVKEPNNSIGVLHRVPVLGGVSVKLIVDVDGPISLSPDGKQLAFVRGSSAGDRALMLANADGSEERKLASRTGYNAFSFGGPAWSPDGKTIACGAGNTDPSGRHMSVVAVEVGDGSVKPLTTQKWSGIGRLAWLQDGKGLVMNARDLGRRSPAQLWYLSYPNGQARRITRDLQDYDGVSLTSDSTVLVSNQTQTISGIWTAPNDDANRAKQILSNKYDGDDGFYSRFSWTPNGQIIYTSLIHGAPSIWVMTAQGTGNRQLTPDSSSNNFPHVTSDARYVVFLSDRTGFTNVWRMDTDGNNEKQLTTGEDDSWAWCSPDGQWVVYQSLALGKRTLRKVSINGGDSEQLTDYPSVGPVVSPDGRWISCYYRPETKAPWKLAIIPFDGGPPVKTFEVPQNVLFTSLVRWTPDGLALAYITSRNGISNIWIQPLDGSPPKQTTDFKSDQIFWFDWSRDGRQLGVSRGAVTSDVVLIKDLR
jgi:serine/threonine protein kinase